MSEPRTQLWGNQMIWRFLRRRRCTPLACTNICGGEERLRRSGFAMKKSVGICVIGGKTLVCEGGVQRLRRRSWLVRDLPHNCVRGAHSIMGLNFRTISVR
ncbi:MAG: hypothetical protein RR061_08180 [Muribaculaceae bacterium]